MGKQKFRQNTSFSPFTSLASLLILCMPLPALHSPCSHTGCSQSLWWGDEWCRMLGSGCKSFCLPCFVFIPLSAAAPLFFLLCISMSPLWAAVLLEKCQVWINHGPQALSGSYLHWHRAPLTALAFLFLFYLRILPFFIFLLTALQTGSVMASGGSVVELEPSETGCIYHKAAAGLAS